MQVSAYVKLIHWW